MCLGIVCVSVIFMQLEKQCGKNGRRGIMFLCKCLSIHLLCVTTRRRNLSLQKWCSWMAIRWTTLRLPVVSLLRVYIVYVCVAILWNMSVNFLLTHTFGTWYSQKDKAKVVPVHAMKADWESRYMTPLICHLNTRWWWMLTFTPQPL
jgi:hypothetical protein